MTSVFFSKGFAQDNMPLILGAVGELFETSKWIHYLF
jgi:hypothetical protein